MRQLVVRPGASALRIALHYTGCPKCVRSLVIANPQKARFTYPNGFITFRELRVGEVLNLPDSWFDGNNEDKSSWAWPPGWDENWQDHYTG